VLWSNRPIHRAEDGSLQRSWNLISSVLGQSTRTCLREGFSISPGFVSHIFNSPIRISRSPQVKTKRYLRLSIQYRFLTLRFRSDPQLEICGRGRPRSGLTQRTILEIRHCCFKSERFDRSLPIRVWRICPLSERPWK